MENKEQGKVPDLLTQSVYVESAKTIENLDEVKGYDFNKGLDYNEMFKTFKYTGF
jgi:hypothetical protein